MENYSAGLKRQSAILKREVMRLFKKQVKQTDIGKRLGVSRQRVHQIINETAKRGNGGGR